MESRTRRRRLSGALAVALLLATSVAAVASAGPLLQTGAFALLGGRATATAALRVAETPGGAANVQLRQFADDGSPILEYAVAMHRSLQMVVVRDDFATFARLDPAFDAATGSFAQALAGIDPTHRYYLYADSTPAGMKQQVFRFTINPKQLPAVPSGARLEASAPTARAGPYRITLAKTTLNADQTTRIAIAVRKGKKPATGLSPSRGGATQAVLIDMERLAYVPVRPVVVGTARDDATFSMALPALPAGSYRLWFQVRQARQKLSTAAFTLVAE